MNYLPNTHHWRVGDLCIHDADAKENGMLMIVVGYGRDGLVKTRYLDPDHGREPEKGRWRVITYRNEARFLHDPRREDIRAAWRGEPFEEKGMEGAGNE